MKSKRVYKYATGDEIPEGAVYLATVVEETQTNSPSPHKIRLVWHYFLVEGKPNE